MAISPDKFAILPDPHSKKYKIYYADRITMNNRTSIKSMRADNICLLREVQK